MCIYLFPPLRLVGFFFPWPKVAPCLLWLGRSWGGMVKSPGLNLFPLPKNFLQPPHLTFTFPHIILLPSSPFPPLTTVCQPGISPPLQPPSTERPLRVCVSPPSPPSPSLVFSGNWWLPPWWAEASLGAAFRRLFHCQPDVNLIWLCSNWAELLSWLQYDG